MAQKATHLKRSLGLTLLTFYGVGMILGAGIYSIIGKAAGEAGESVWISLVIAAVVALLTALSYAELASMLPQTGGEFIYLRKAFPKWPWVAQLAGLLIVLAGVSTSSAVAVAFAGYLQELTQVPILLSAFLLLAIFSAFNIRGVKESSWANVLFTLIELSGLALIVYFGLQQEDFLQSLSAVPSAQTLTASALIIFAYFGFENIVNFAEETERPEKTLPRAIFLSLLISTIIYVLVAVSALSLLPPKELAASSAPLAEAIRQVAPGLASLLSSVALFATANTVLISLITASRVVFSMAREGALPKKLARVHGGRQTPWLAAIAVFVGACLILPLGDIEVLASLSSFATMSSFVLVNLTLIVLRYTHADLKRPYKVPLSLGKFPLLAALAALSSLVLLMQFESRIHLVGIAFVVAILAILLVNYLLKRWK